MTDTVTKQKLIEHPLEQIFDIEPGTTVTEFVEALPTEIVTPVSYDDKDSEVDTQYQEIYDVAMTQVSAISDEMARVEGRHKARIGEVTATMLNVALSAAREKAQLKMHKDKLSARALDAVGNAAANTAGGKADVIIADRNEILRALLNKKTGNP